MTAFKQNDIVSFLGGTDRWTVREVISTSRVNITRGDAEVMVSSQCLRLVDLPVGVQERLRIRAELIARRKEEGYLQRAVAARMGTKQQHVSRFEHGDGRPRLDTLRRYARAVHLEVVIEGDRLRLVEA